MEQAEGSRENVGQQGKDLGSTSDRAMFADRSTTEERGSMADDQGMRGMSNEKAMRRMTSDENRSQGGGITNRGRDVEDREQAQLPRRGEEKGQ